MENNNSVLPQQENITTNPPEWQHPILPGNCPGADHVLVTKRGFVESPQSTDNFEWVNVNDLPGGGGTGGVTKAYVDGQDEQVLAEAKEYADEIEEAKQDKLIAGDNITLTPTSEGVEISAEVPEGVVGSVNSKTPDENGNVSISASDINATNGTSIQANLERIDERIDDLDTEQITYDDDNTLKDKLDAIDDHLDTLDGDISTAEVNIGNLQTGLETANTNIGNLESEKQDNLIAGEGITIASDGKTISASGGNSGIDINAPFTGSAVVYADISLSDAQVGVLKDKDNAVVRVHLMNNDSQYVIMRRTGVTKQAVSAGYTDNIVLYEGYEGGNAGVSTDMGKRWLGLFQPATKKFKIVDTFPTVAKVLDMLNDVTLGSDYKYIFSYYVRDIFDGTMNECYRYISKEGYDKFLFTGGKVDNDQIIGCGVRIETSLSTGQWTATRY